MGADTGREGTGFRELRVWQEAIALAGAVLAIADRMPIRYASLTDQLLRAATSVHANIAEGAWHRSPREFVRFLRIARASLVELESHVAFVLNAGLASTSDARRVTDRTRRIDQLLRGLVRAIQSSPR
jgi:four helix bundle protein